MSKHQVFNDPLTEHLMRVQNSYSTHTGSKNGISAIYSKLTLVSTNNRSFSKPALSKINEKVSIGDNGTVTVFTGTYKGHSFGPDDYLNAPDATGCFWYELEGYPQNLKEI